MKNRYLFAVILFLLAIVLPFVVTEFWVHVLTEILILALFAASFNMIFGYMGQLSFGHAAYYGVGAYTTGLLMVKANVPMLVCLPLSMFSAGLCAAVLGYFCVKLRGIYFAILTMAFGQLVYYIIFQWYSFTGGDNGLQGIVPPDFLGRAANPYYFFTLIVVTVGLIALWIISESPFGYTMRAIRDNAERTEFIGINVQRYMHLNFIIAAVFAGLAGALWGPFNRSVAPDLTNWQHSGMPVFMTVIGGPFSFLGPLFGSAIYTFLMALVTSFTEYWPLVSGVIIILVVLLMPGGLLGLLNEKFPSLMRKVTGAGETNGQGRQEL